MDYKDPSEYRPEVSAYKSWLTEFAWIGIVILMVTIGVLSDSGNLP